MTRDATSGKSEERWFLIRLVVLFALAVMVFGLLVSLRGGFLAAKFPRAQLPDGTWLVARSVSVGTRHAVEVPFPRHVQYSRWQRNFLDSTTTQTERMVIWLTRENDKGQMLDLDWFGRCELVYTDQLRVGPRQYHKQIVQNNGSSGNGTGERGYGDAKPFGSSKQVMDAAVVRFELPLQRPRDGKMTLAVYDGAKNVVAQLELPVPDLPGRSFDVWQPDPLPATRTVGDLTVTLTSIKRYRDPDSIFISVMPYLQYSIEGKPAGSWSAIHELTDALGNSCQSWNSDLSPLETAWKLKLTMSQMTSGQFSPKETLKLPLKSFASTGQLLLLSETHTVNQSAVTVIGLGGAGPIEFTLPNSNSQFKTGAYNPGSHGFGMSTSCRNSQCDVSISSGAPFVVTSARPAPDSSVQLVIRDQSGEVLNKNSQGSVEGLTFWFFEPKPTSTQIEIQIIAQKLRYAEFLIAPPTSMEVEGR